MTVASLAGQWGLIMAEQRWIPETLFDEFGFRMTFAVERVLYEMQTEHQHLVLFEHKLFGKEFERAASISESSSKKKTFRNN